MFVALVASLCSSPALAQSLSSTPLSQPRTGLSAVSVDRAGQVLFAGGQLSRDFASVSDLVDIYDESTSAWSTATLSAPRKSIVPLSVGSLVLLAGGIDANIHQSPVLDIYDATSGAWTTDTLPRVRGIRVAVALDSMAVFVGNASEVAEAPLATGTYADAYDSGTGQWTTLPDPPVGPIGLAGVVLDHQLLMTGADFKCGAHGYQGCPAIPTRQIAIFNASTLQWTAASALSEPRWGVHVVATPSRALFAGGYTTDNVSSVSNTLDVFDATAQRWSTGQLPHAKLAGQVAVGESVVFASTDPPVIDILDTRSNAWQTRSIPSGQAPSVVTANGRAAVLIGTRGGGQPDTAEIYDLDADSWTTLSLSTSAPKPLVVSLGNQLLVAGSDTVDVLEFSASAT